jgi:hypothetical protein
MVFQQGRLLFYRCKPLGGDAVEAGAKADLSDKIIEECGASLDLCQQRHPTAVIKRAILCADGESAGLKTRLEAGLDLSVEQMGWDTLDKLGPAAKGNHSSMASLVAMAGVS